MKNLICFVLICFSLPGYTQNKADQKKTVQTKMSRKEYLADSLAISKRESMIRPQFKLDNRVIFFNFQKLGIFGFDAGILLKEKLRLTLGYYTISNKLTTIEKVINNVEYKGQYALDYTSINLEIIYKNKPLYSLGMPVELGIGGNRLTYTSDITNLPTDTRRGAIAMLYFGLSGTFKPIKWLGIKAAVGYRKTVLNGIKGLSFDGFYYSVGLAVDFGEVIIGYKMYRLKKQYRKNANSVGTAVDLITR
jgi:hypothetical protein